MKTDTLDRDDVRRRVSDARRPHRSVVNLALVGLSLIIGMVILPCIYALGLAVPYSIPMDRLWDGWLALNIALNAAANTVVMLSAIRLDGRLDRRLAAVFSHTVILHGAFGFILLTARFPHSNQVMLMAAVMSPILGGIIAAIKHATVPRRVALVGPWSPLVDELRGSVDWIDNPGDDFRDYEVLLTTGMTDVDPIWTDMISRALLHGTRVRHLAEFFEETQGLVSIEHFDLDQVPAKTLTSYRIRKRLIDIALAVMAAPFALIIVGVAAVAILAAMGRPILFKQSRTGLGGKSFEILKLRTMLNRAQEPSTATKSVGDPRITRLGRALRRFRIDELPQLWNVIKGDMSLIGPRPEWTALAEQYAKELPVYSYRHLVRPGISGWAQVRGGYAADLSETRTKVGYDLFYIKNLSFSLDMQILVRTAWTILTGFGAR